MTTPPDSAGTQKTDQLFEELTQNHEESGLTNQADSEDKLFEEIVEQSTSVSDPHDPQHSEHLASRLPGGPSGSFFDSIGPDTATSSADTAVQELLSAENLLLKTDLSRNAVPIVARILTLAIKYKARNLWNFLWTYLQARVSLDRKGRQEIVALQMRRQGYDGFDEGF